MPYKDLAQLCDQVKTVENPWERAIRTQIIAVQSLLILEENSIEVDLNEIKEYVNESLGNDTDYFQTLLKRHKGMIDRRDQLSGKLQMLESIVSGAESALRTTVNAKEP